MELETKKSKGKVETIRHWSDKEVKEVHKKQGYAWRSNRLKLRVLPVSDEFRKNYDDINWGNK